MEKSMFAIVLSGILLNNYALQNYLGISALLGTAKDAKKSAVLGGAVTVVMVLSAAVCWPVDHFVLSAFGLEYLRTLVFVAIILAAAYLVSAVVKTVVKKPLGIWFPLVALNSAVLGAALNNAAEGLNFLQAVVSALAAGLGFLLAIVVFSGVCDRIEEQHVPRAFRGLPVRLMAAAIIGLALYAF